MEAVFKMELCIFKHIFLPMMKTLPSFPPYESGSHGLHCGGSVSSRTCVLSHVQPSATPLSMGFSRQEYWVAGPAPGDLHDPGTEPTSLVSPALAGGFFTTSATWRDLLLGSGSSPAPLEEGGLRGLCGVAPRGPFSLWSWPPPAGLSSNGSAPRGFRPWVLPVFPGSLALPLRRSDSASGVGSWSFRLYV